MSIMSTPIKIHPEFDVYFLTLGRGLQSRVTILCGATFNETSGLTMVEPGRTIVIGDIDEELRQLIGAMGKPTLNQLTSTTDRPGGVFSSGSYVALTQYLFDQVDANAPRRGQRIQKTPRFRDLETVQ